LATILWQLLAHPEEQKLVLYIVVSSQLPLEKKKQRLNISRTQRKHQSGQISYSHHSWIKGTSRTERKERSNMQIKTAFRVNEMIKVRIERTGKVRLQINCELQSS
jgi:hypothetical protein